MMAKFFIFLLCALVAGCVTQRVKRYRDLLDPLVGKEKKANINRLLGKPANCEQEQDLEKCEYRTTKERNDPVPIVHERESALGPDLSPYDTFDVLYLYYDGFGVLKDWKPVSVPQ